MTPGLEQSNPEPAEEAPAGGENGESLEPGDAAEEEGAPGLLQPCSNCATLLEVGDLEPFAKVHCPICGTAMRARTQLKNFTLVEVLGAGGMGAVYKALDTNLDRMVALKVVRKEFSADAEYLAKFEREARITASVNHPHVVKVYSFGSDHGLFYIAMELVDKGSLDDLMNLQGRVAEVQALGVGIQVAQGLEAAHQKGLIHRDVKPGNILFAGAQTAKIVDFGLALLAEHEAEERGEVWGTPYYVAPEKLDHQPEDFRSDLYSLGGTLFHAIAGRPPFEAETASMVALKHLKSQAVSLQAFAPDVSSATAYVINRMLHKDPDQRYQSYGELVEHLEYARNQLTDAAGGARKPRQRVVVESSTQQRAAGIITAVLLLILIGAGWAGYKYRDRIFGHGDAAPDTAGDDPQAATRNLHTQFDSARKLLIAGDYAGAQEALRKLDDQPEITQPMQNWVTLHHGLASLLAGNLQDARDWFKVVKDRSHFSSDASDAGLVNFFSAVGEAMASGGPVGPNAASQAALDAQGAMAPLLYGLKDWEMGRFDDAAKLLGIYLAATPKEPFSWIADLKPLAQKDADEYAAYQKVAAAATGADTPEKRTDVLKQVQDLKATLQGKLGAKLNSLEAELKKKSADLDPIYNQQIAAQKEQDEEALRAINKTFALLCADFRFDEAQAAVSAVTVKGSDAQKQKDILLRKAAWLRQFKATLIKDINTSGYNDPIINRNGGRLPDGPKKAAEASIMVQTPFGDVPVPWNSLTPATLLTMENHFAQAASSPEQAADRQWLSGVFACQEGMARDGRALLVQASQAKDAYKDQLQLFLQTE